MKQFYRLDLTLGIFLESFLNVLKDSENFLMMFIDFGKWQTREKNKTIFKFLSLKAAEGQTKRLRGETKH